MKVKCQFSFLREKPLPMCMYTTESVGAYYSKWRFCKELIKNSRFGHCNNVTLYLAPRHGHFWPTKSIWHVGENWCYRVPKHCWDLIFHEIRKVLGTVKIDYFLKVISIFPGIESSVFVRHCLCKNPIFQPFNARRIIAKKLVIS